MIRWCIARSSEDFKVQPGRREDHARKLGSSWLGVVSGEPAVFRTLAVRGVVVLPGLETPAARLSQPVLDWAASFGISPDPDDRLLNLLRRARDAAGETMEINSES